MNTLRKPFDPDNDFVVAKPLIVSNVQHKADPTVLFDKKLISGRLLRQLYEQLYLEVADPSKLSKDPAPAQKKKIKRAPRFTDATETADGTS